MTTNVRGYAATSPTSPLAPFRFERRDPRPDDVVIDILYCGVCHSDLHTARNDWGWSSYPIVPGHEIIGRVVSVGADVTKYKAGDHVGVGCLVDSCGHCPACKHDHEQHCPESTYTYGGTDRHDGQRTQGGYSEKIVVSEQFVLRIPEGLDLKGAAPLLCAGITAWSALKSWNVGPSRNGAGGGRAGSICTTVPRPPSAW